MTDKPSITITVSGEVDIGKTAVLKLVKHTVQGYFPNITVEGCDDYSYHLPSSHDVMQALEKMKDTPIIIKEVCTERNS